MTIIYTIFSANNKEIMAIIYTIFSVNNKATGIRLAILHHILPAIVFLNSENEKV